MLFPIWSLFPGSGLVYIYVLYKPDGELCRLTNGHQAEVVQLNQHAGEAPAAPDVATVILILGITYS